MKLTDLNTPAALINVPRMQHNILRMQEAISRHGVSFRPHVKTSKCQQVVDLQVAAGARGITVSTLKEAEQFFAIGVTDILYAVCIAAPKLAQAAKLMGKGCQLQLITDSLDGAQAVVAFSRTNHIQFNVLIEIDTDNHRSGVKPNDDLLIAIGRCLHDGGQTLLGVMTHAGSSYSLNNTDALQAMAEQERSLSVLAATRLRAAHLPCAVVSIGSTPTALSAQKLEGITEVRAGVYVFFDLVMANVGVCSHNDIALAVLTTVIGHQDDKGWAIVDAGWMAMSRDRGTQNQLTDYGYGQVCDVNGTVLHGFTISGANQEHGIISYNDGKTGSTLAVSKSTEAQQSIMQKFPVGTQLLVLPNHACATGAQFPEYQALHENGAIETWPRFYGW
jgi:threo-3-hydroxy-D-aspartate ammonia-lyase